MDASHVADWQPAPAALPLPASTIHVWRTTLDRSDGELAPLRASLSADELVRAERLIWENKRRRFIAGRGFLRTILGRYLQRAPADLVFCYGLHGKPALADAEDLHFNLSHSAECAVLAVTRVAPLGVDVERIRSQANREGIAGRFFSAAEVAQLASVAPEQRDEAFFNCWTRKEAYVKACGEGLARPLDQFAV